MCPLFVNNIIYRILYYENRVTKIPVLYEINNEPYVSSNYENTGKTVTVVLTTSYDAETNTSLAEKVKNVWNTTSKVALTTANWVRILTEAT